MRTRPASAAGPGRRSLGEGGFTIVELVISTAITLGVTSAIFGLIHPAQGTFQAQPEISDMHQRLRVGIDTLAKDLLMAGAGLSVAKVAPVVPYRTGEQDSDTDLAVFYRPDAITTLYVPWAETEIVSHTYYLKSDPATGMSQLMHYDGAQSDFPVVDHVVRLAFEYFDTDAAPLDPAILQDGPWVPDDPEATTFDADLLRIRRIRVLVRVEAALASMRGPAGTLFTHGGTSTAAQRYVPDQEIRFDVAPRNMNRDR